MIRVQAETKGSSERIDGRARGAKMWLPSPLLVLAAALAVCLVLLLLPVTLPVGPN